MKTMTCKQLGGACNQKFQGETFDEIALQSKEHGLAMVKIKDSDHLAAMENMKILMENPQNMETWFQNKKSEFDLLPDD